MIALFYALSLISTALASPMGPWESYSSPFKLPFRMETKFVNLPLFGEHHKVKNSGWSDDYWPSQQGSINRRWLAPGEPGFKLDSPTLAEAQNMSLKELEQLAPSEKYDLWLGRYHYPLVRRVDGIATPRARDWAGICHGWAPASLNHSEPSPKVKVNPQGIQIPFGSSDIKAILSFYYAFEVEQETFQIGLRCFLGRGLGGFQRGCRDDLNAGAFHLIIANKLGIRGEGFIADIDRYKEVWNQPIFGFSSKVLNPSIRPNSQSSPEAVILQEIETILTYVDESEPQFEPVLGTSFQQWGQMRLSYLIELNDQGEIVGGEWLTEDRPDFLWFREAAEFKGDFKALEELL